MDTHVGMQAECIVTHAMKVIDHLSFWLLMHEAIINRIGMVEHLFGMQVRVMQREDGSIGDDVCAL